MAEMRQESTRGCDVRRLKTLMEPEAGGVAGCLLSQQKEKP